MERERMLALLRDQHEFPGPFVFRAVVRPGGRAAVVSAVRAACGPEEDVLHVEERASREGRWVSLHLHVRVGAPEAVVGIYEVLHALDEVVFTL